MKSLLILIMAAAIIAGSWLLSAWWMMLGTGIAHRDWWHAVPLMSFHVALILVWFFAGVLSGLATLPALIGSKKKK